MNQALMAVDQKTVIETFRALRVQMKQTQARTGDKAGYSPHYIAVLETGAWYPRKWNGWATLERMITMGLGMSVDEFVLACQGDDKALA